MRTEDGYVISKCLNGEPEAFGFLMDKYKGSVYAFTYSKLRNFHDAEDVTQEVFIKAYQKLRSLRRWDNFLAWLYAITSNMCKNWIRLKANRPDSEFVEDQNAEILMQPFNLTNTEPYASISSLSGKSMAREDGEFPVDVMKMSDMTFTSDQHLPGNGLGNVAADLQNALFMAPQAEGGTWTKKADILTRKFALSTSVVNGKIYAIGGQAPVNVTVPTVEEYDPVTDKWTKKADMPTPRMNLSTTAANGKIYAIGGHPWQGAEIPTVEEYNPKNDKWTKRANIPTKRAMHSAEAVDGKIYVIGGWRWDGPKSTVEEYDPEKDEWVKKTDMPTARTRLSATAVNRKIYAIGGSGSLLVDPEVHFSTVEEYDPLTDTWTKKTDMPTPRGWFSSSEVNGKIYAIGGRNNNGTTSVVEEYDPGSTGEGVDFKGKLPTTWGEVRTALSK
jgi:RNA polymerase sigma factor (sigma-70 family)